MAKGPVDEPCGCRTWRRRRASRSPPPRAACPAPRASARRSPSGCARSPGAMGYVANVHARSLAGGASRSVGLLVHEIGDPYFTEIASGVLRRGRPRGADRPDLPHGPRPRAGARPDPHPHRQPRRRDHHRGLGLRRPRPPGARPRPTWRRYRRLGGRVAVIGRHHLGVDAVLPDNTEGPRRGPAPARPRPPPDRRRRRLAASSPPSPTGSPAIEEAFTAAGLAFADVPVVEADLHPGRRQAGARRRSWPPHPDVTAVLALNDDMAIGVLSVLRDRGIAVPGRMSVTGLRRRGRRRRPGPVAHDGAAADGRHGRAGAADGAQGTRRRGRAVARSVRSSSCATRSGRPPS